MVDSPLRRWEGLRVGAYEMHSFVDRFVVGLSLHLGERLDGELARNLVDCLWLACHRGGFDPYAAAST